LISKVRQMSLDLRPSMLDDLGIAPTIIWHIDRYTSQTGIQVNFQQTNVQNRRFRSEIETTIYRVVQEALTNIARHANVKNAAVRLWCTDKILGVQIEDEGQGFDPDEALSTHQSRGLLGMRERVGFIGGQLSIVSQPGQGASLTIEIPLEGRLERRSHVR
jgi:signal transduction histidine kinase